MDRIRHMIERDPYEALFGYSNRLLKGMRRADWPLDLQKQWWHREMSFTVRNPFVGQKVENETPRRTSTAEKSITKTEIPPEPEFEYDPITGRMVLKVSSTTLEPSERTPTSVGKHQTPVSTTGRSTLSPDQGVIIPVKPYRPVPQPPQPRARVTPSFTLLKEDLSQENSQENLPKAEPEPISPARAQYEQFKAKRLQEAERNAKWLESEGFQDTKLDSSANGSRSSLEKRFDDIHSPAQELAEDKLVDKRPWEAQRSSGTTVPNGSTFADWRQKAKIPAYDEKSADREIREYVMQVAGDNLENRRAIDGAKTSISQENEPYKPLVHPAMDATAHKDIRDYATRVASDNLKTRRFAEQQKARQDTDEQLAVLHKKEFESLSAEQSQPYKPLVHPAMDASANEDIRDYAAQVASDNLQARRFEEQQKAKQVTDGQFAALRRKQFEEFNAETKRMSEDRAEKVQAKDELQQVRSTLQDVKARLAEFGIPDVSVAKSSSTLETSLQRHQEKSAIAQSPPLRTSLQRLNNTTSEVVLRPDQSWLSDTEQVRTHDPVGYNHNRESRHLQRLSSTRKAFRVPTLAEVFGYRKAGDSAVNSKTIEKNEIDPSAGWLLSEIESQKAAFNRFESSRKEPEVAVTKEAMQPAKPSKTLAEQFKTELEQKKMDTQLVREIKQIYEDKYGPITTSHSQIESAVAMETEARPAVEPSQSRTNIAEELTQSDLVATSPIPVAPISSISQIEQEPSSTLTTPTPSKTARYTILAWDSKSKTMTTASFESIPSTTEKAMPTTIALRHLAYGNRFLPKLIELQHRGFLPVHAERNLLILRQDGGKNASLGVSEGSEEEVVQSERFVDLLEGRPSSQESDAKEPKRLEPVFSGASEKQRERAWRKWKEEQRQESRRRRRRFGRAVRFVGGGVVLSGAVVYLAGVGAEVRQHRGRGKVVVMSDGVTRG
jgi:hypothetical protein